MTSKDEMEFLIDFTVEVLHGCKWNCAGCNVGKNEQNGFLEGDRDRLLSLFADLKANHHILSNFAIGPTDFMTADNGREMLIETQPMMDMFAAVTLQTAFLEKPDQIVQWAEFLRPILAGREVKFAVPLDPRHYKNRKFFETILSNRDLLVSLLPETKYTKTYLIGNLVEYRDYNADPFNNDKITFEEYSELFHEASNGNHLDLVIANGRSPLTDLNNREALKSVVRYQNRLYNEAIQTEASKTNVNFTYGKLHEGFDKDYIYKNGSIYSPVFAGEPLVVFEPDYGLSNDVEWTTASLIDYENDFMVESLEYLERTTQCSSCEFAHVCAGRGILKLMKTLRVTDCFAPKQAFQYIRTQSI